MPYDPALPLLDIYPDKTVSQKDTCTPMLTTALFITAKTWKQSKCPSTDEWIKKMWYIYAVEYYSAIEKQQSNAICSKLNVTRDNHTKWSKKEKNHMISRTCVIYNVTQMNLSLKKKQNHEHREQTGSCQAEERDAEVGISRRKLSYREWINNKVLCIVQRPIFNVLW